MEAGTLSASSSRRHLVLSAGLKITFSLDLEMAWFAEDIVVYLKALKLQKIQ
jgi:hypothetical protein